jgi:tetratricopeptide (TPR) repeat protein
MIRHIALIIILTATALAAGVAMVPGEREQWTMLVRDGRNQEALKVLEAQYRAGRREVDAVIHLHKLYMSFAEIEQATRVMQDFVAAHPDDPEAVAMLAKHYGDIEDKQKEIATLERLFELSPSVPTARDLLAYYRLEGAFDREENLLRLLLVKEMITANDAERLGLILVAHDDLFGAREALTRFDEIANPERSIGRLVLFDVLVATGDKTTALAKAASWIGHFRKASIHHAAEGETPAERLVRKMVAVDEAAAHQLICQVQRDEAPLQASAEPWGRVACEVDVPGAQTDAEAPTNAVSDVEPRDEFGRRKPR